MLKYTSVSSSCRCMSFYHNYNPLHLHLITFNKDAGAAACSILLGLNRLAVSSLIQPHSSGSMLLPFHACTWWYTRLLWKRAASSVGGSLSGGTYLQAETSFSLFFVAHPELRSAQPYSAARAVLPAVSMLSFD